MDLASITRERLTRSRSEEHTSELQSQSNLVCRLLLEKQKIRHHQLLSVGRDSTLRTVPPAVSPAPVGKRGPRDGRVWRWVRVPSFPRSTGRYGTTTNC